VSGQTRRIPWTRETVLLALLWVWYSITTFFALVPQDAFAEWDKVSKILLMSFATLMLIQEKQKFTFLFGAIAFSLASLGSGVWFGESQAVRSLRMKVPLDRLFRIITIWRSPLI